MQLPLPNDRGSDYYEAQNIKWNCARIVRLSSGNYAVLSPYDGSAIDLIKVGTLEEVAAYIPSYEEIVAWLDTKRPRQPPPKASAKGTTADLMADIGLT